MHYQDAMTAYAVESGLLPSPDGYVLDEKFYAELSNESVELATVAGQIDRAEAALESIHYLSQGFFKGRPVTEESAKLFSLSVESVIIAARLNIPTEMLAPSFESSSVSDYSTEAEEKKANVVVRIWRWIVAAIKNLGRIIGGIFKKRKMIFANVIKDLGKMREMLKRIIAEDAKPVDPDVEDDGDYAGCYKGDDFKSAADVNKDISDLKTYIANLSTIFDKYVNYKGESTKADQIIKELGIRPGKYTIFDGVETTLDERGWRDYSEHPHKPKAGRRKMPTAQELLAIVDALEKMIDATETGIEDFQKRVDKYERRAQAQADEAIKKFNAISEKKSNEENNKLMDEWISEAPKEAMRLALNMGRGVNDACNAVSMYEINWKRALQLLISRFRVQERKSDRTGKPEDDE